MQVNVLYFGVLRDRFGAPDAVVELPDGATVGKLLEVLRGPASKHWMSSESQPGPEDQLWRSLAVAVNREYGSTSIVLREGDEVALLPPVSGGSFVEGTARTAKGSLRSQNAESLEESSER
ncbi:MAG TPA: MoaD/ThiS family protein [Acidobacteriaceae bacterium]|jgi:molybdopterin converting factor small subunit